MESYSEITARAKPLEAELIRIRRQLHMQPELGRQEHNTSYLLKERLKKCASLKIIPVTETGFCADLVIDANKPWIALRGDMDALAIKDNKNVAYASQVEGMCHACGHDVHSTVVLGTAILLGELDKKLNCNIRFIFQHAEEPTPGGALDFVKAGMLDDISAIFGLHVDPNLAVPSIGLIPGWISAQSIHIKMGLSGKGGHSARPHLAADPVFGAVSLLNHLYSALSRKYRPESPFVFTVGKIQGGNGYNSIASEFSSEGTLRITDVAQRTELLEFIEQTITHFATSLQLTPHFEAIIGAPPVVNDERLTDWTLNTLKNVLKPDQICQHKRSMGGEDFSHYLSKVPGVFMRVGVGTGKGLHTGDFDVDESAITFATGLFSWLLIEASNAQNVLTNACK